MQGRVNPRMTFFTGACGTFQARTLVGMVVGMTRSASSGRTMGRLNGLVLSAEVSLPGA